MGMTRSKRPLAAELGSDGLEGRELRTGNKFSQEVDGAGEEEEGEGRHFRSYSEAESVWDVVGKRRMGVGEKGEAGRRMRRTDEKEEGEGRKRKKGEKEGGEEGVRNWKMAKASRHSPKLSPSLQIK